MKKNGSEWRTDCAAMALVAPLVLVPAITVGAIFWARYESILLHPDEAARNPPTISRAIADPVIGDVFALWMLGVAVFQAFAVYRITQALYRTALSSSSDSARYRAGMKALLGAIWLLQAIAIIGMVMLSQYTGSISDYLHQLGSYLMFFGNGLFIAVIGLFVGLDRAHRNPSGAPETDPPCPYDHWVHTRLAAVVSIVGLVFAILFYGDEVLRPLNDYGYRVVFAMCEIVLLVGSVIYLASFVTPLYRYERHMLRRRMPERETAQIVGDRQNAAH